MVGVLFAAFMLLFQVPASKVPAPPAKGLIEGTVLVTGSGDPAERARLSLTRITPPQAQTASTDTPPPPIQPIQTEKDGRFSFKDLEAGQYRLRVQRNGYAPQEYGQKSAATSGTVINLTEGQQFKDITFRLIPAATLSGRVRDSNGDPVPSAQVTILRSIYNSNGQRNLTSAGNATTDDRGEYRIFWVPPGRYVLSAGGNSNSAAYFIDGEFISTSRSQNSFADRTFPRTYYPGTLDPSRATTIELLPGAELNGMDVVLTQPSTFRIRGKIVDATTGKPPKYGDVSLQPRVEQGSPGTLVVAGGTSASTTYNNVAGTFEIRNVMPGIYWISASTSSDFDEPVNPNLAATARTAGELLDSIYMNSTHSGRIPIEVTNSDIEEATLTLTAGLSIPLRLQVEGQDLSSITGLDRIRVYLTPVGQGSSNAYQAISFNSEGVGTLGGVSPGEFKVAVNLPSPELYLKEALFERTDVLNRPWEITSQSSGTLSIVLSGKVGVIEGSLVDALSQPVRGNSVVLIPDQGLDRPLLYKTATTDQNGRFTIRGIAPGGYQIYAWESIEPNAWYDREVLAQYENHSKHVRIQESTREAVDLKLIPARSGL